MRILVCPDKFRDSATASELVTTTQAALSTRFGAAVTFAGQPLADGGEGTLEALGGPNRVTSVPDPLGQDVDARWRLANRVATIEMAQASGLGLVGGKDNNDALAASTEGTGMLIVEAAERGAQRIIVAVGGSATTDGGLGALRAMHPLGRFRGLEIIVACDVDTTFIDAATVFAPQKGATGAQVKLLSARLARLVDAYQTDYGVDVSSMPHSGAAGGLAGGLAAGVGAALLSGFDVVADEVDLVTQIEAADLVVTGEGRLDPTSFAGKVVGGVWDIAAAGGVRVAAICGSVADECSPPETLEVVSLSDRFGGDASMADAPGLFARSVVELVGEVLDGATGP